MEHFTLANGNTIPALAFGSGSKWRVAKLSSGQDSSCLAEDLVEAVKEALLAGFTHLDTAEVYDTHREVCEGIKRSGIARSALCITTKYLPGYRGKHAISVTGPYEAIQRALEELETDYIDCYFIHNPFFNLEWTHGVTVEDAWLQLEKAYNEGLVRNIGVSNFSKDIYEQVLEVCTVKPQILQVEMHPYCYNQHPGIVEFGKKHGAQIEAYGTLTPILRVPEGPLSPVLQELALRYDRSPAQVLLRWVYQQGVIPLTTSSSPKRLREALEIFNFAMSDEDVLRITEIGATYPYREYFQEEFGKHSCI